MKNRIETLLKKINTRSTLLLDEPMKNHTSFRIGGPADFFVRARNLDDLKVFLTACHEFEIPCFVLGDGSKLLVSDKGIRGVTFDLSLLNHVRREENFLMCEAGALVRDVCETSLKHGLSGFEFIYGMPGSIGGALWMNARCYDHEMSEMCDEARFLEPSGREKKISLADKTLFSYKVSPFQTREGIITEVTLRLRKGDRSSIQQTMQRHLEHRIEKKQFLFPSAGSAFKNNRAFGKPSGKIIDDLGLRGLRCGAAELSFWHANHVINLGEASAQDVADLLVLLAKIVYEKTGFQLEPEILYVGDWGC